MKEIQMLSKSVIITLDAKSDVTNVQFVTVNVPDDMLDIPTVSTTDAGDYKLVKVTFGTKIPDFSKFTIGDFKQIAVSGEYKNSTTVKTPAVTPGPEVAVKLEDVKPAELTTTPPVVKK